MCFVKIRLIVFGNFIRTNTHIHMYVYQILCRMQMRVNHEKDVANDSCDVYSIIRCKVLCLGLETRLDPNM